MRDASGLREAFARVARYISPGWSTSAPAGRAVPAFQPVRPTGEIRLVRPSTKFSVSGQPRPGRREWLRSPCEQWRRGRGGLYQALAERHTRVLMDAVRGAFLRPGEMRARPRAAIDTYLAAIAAKPHLYGFLVHRAGSPPPAVPEVPRRRPPGHDHAGTQVASSSSTSRVPRTTFGSPSSA
ncbi:MAG: TetR family transcriptional regulator [Actinoallomurus sp.]|nr:TetR family transcriptional regulator [Actinoallomurus sp.]